MNIHSLQKWQLPIFLTWALTIAVFSSALVHKLLFSKEAIIDNSVGVWFDKKDPELIDYKNYNASFGEKEWSVLLLQTESIYDPEFLKQLAEISSRIEKVDNVIKVTSITNIRDNFNNSEGMLDYRALYSPEVLTDTDARLSFIDALKRNPIFEKNLILADDDRFTVLLVQNSNKIYDKSTYRIDLVDSIGSIVSAYPAIEQYSFAGTTVVNAELNRAAVRDVFVFYTLVTILLTAIALYMLRSIRNLLVMYAVVTTCVIPAMGLLAIFGISFNIMTVMLPTVLIALSVAGVIHIISEFHQHRTEHTSLDAISMTMRNLFKPTIWTTVTTVFGFGVFTVSNVIPVFQFGALAAVGLIMACIANLFIAPLLLVYLWPDALQTPLTLRHRTLPGWMDMGQRFPRLVLATLLLLLIPLGGLLDLEVDTNYVKFFSSSHQTTQSYDAIKHSGFAQNPVVLHLQFPEDAPYSSANYTYVSNFEAELAKFPEIIKLLTPGDFLSEINTAFNGNNAEPVHTYNKAQIDQLLLLAELSGNDDLSDLLNYGGTDIQLVLLTDYLGNRKLEHLRERIETLRQQYLPDSVNLTITGTTTLWANMDEDVTHTQIGSLALIAIFLAVFLPWIFGSLNLGLIALAVNMIPLGVALGTMALAGIKINMATALVGAMTLGVVVDDTIHFVYALTRYRRAGYTTESAISQSLTTVGLSIVRTTVILVVGFFCMASSQFLPTAHFGIFIALSITLALVLDVFGLPALLRTFPSLLPGNRDAPELSMSAPAQRDM